MARGRSYAEVAADKRPERDSHKMDDGDQGQQQHDAESDQNPFDHWSSPIFPTNRHGPRSHRGSFRFEPSKGAKERPSMVEFWPRSGTFRALVSETIPTL